MQFAFGGEGLRNYQSCVMKVTQDIVLLEHCNFLSKNELKDIVQIKRECDYFHCYKRVCEKYCSWCNIVISISANCTKNVVTTFQCKIFSTFCGGNNQEIHVSKHSFQKI